MAAEKTRRKLFRVAKELNLSHQTIIEFLEKKGYAVSGLNTPITDDIYEEILKRFAQEKVKAEKIARRRKETIKEEEAVQEKPAEVTTETPAEAVGEEETVAEKSPADEIEAEKTEEVSEEPEAEEIQAEEKPVSEEPAEIEAETAEETEEEPAEAVAEQQEEESEEETKPAIGDIIDHPVAKQFLQQEEEKKKKKSEKKKEMLQKIKEDGKTETRKKKDKKGKEKEEEVVPKRVRAIEHEEAELEELVSDEKLEEEDKGRKKKEKKKKQFEEELSDKERRRRKALEMIRKEGRKTKIPKTLVELEEGEETVDKDERKRRTRKKKEVDQQEVDETLKKTLASMQDTGIGKKRKKKVKSSGEEEVEEQNVVTVTEFMTVQDLANSMEVPASDIIRKCLDLGQMVTVNQRLDMEMIRLLAEDYGFRIEEEEEFASSFLEETLEEKGNPKDFKPKHPVVTVMGHVDHGKTSLLDYIRHANVVAGESGGITQHIGAYVVEMEDGRKITFLDTPGHEAFTAMRSRGAQVTDIVVLVVAADDRVMPQTEEAIDHARAAGVPIIIAINKIDKPNANPQAIRKQLADRNILVEDWGGKFQVTEVSAKTGEGIDELLEKIQLEAEILELKANPKKRATGVVVESRLDKGKGPVATVLVQHGVLTVGQDFLVGQYYGRVRALLNERNQVVEEAGPGYPVQILGIDGVPEAGDKLIVMHDEKQVREIAQRRQQLKREQDFRQIRLLTLDEISRQIQEGSVKELNIIVKADVDGSAQALSDSLQKLSNRDVAVKVVRRAVGPITESDIMLAAASHAIIIGFHVRPQIKAKELAEEEKVDIRLYKVIYNAIDDIHKALEGLLEPEEKEQILGTLEVREVFKVSRLGTVAGCYVLDGKINRNSLIRLIRNDVEIYEGRLSSLKRFKEDVREVSSGYECGLMIENYNDLKVGDMIEAFEMVQEKRTLQT
ncbi:MAG: translation initiation factor IF-2 [Calditrichaeota bacterium]|nr:translation initiation factor IF-2 [Calditrichota bacterium]RQV92586.1 MAG: translation initiation factor IF-2 [bacterium]RQW07584.1 MAG: translation initiation factor IF-2 [Calditrichota bacterium]